MTLKTYQSFVDGAYLSNQSSKRFDVVNPATGELVYKVEVADDSVKLAAIESAQRDFQLWSAKTGIERSRVLLKDQHTCSGICSRPR